MECFETGTVMIPVYLHSLSNFSAGDGDTNRIIEL